MEDKYNPHMKQDEGEEDTKNRDSLMSSSGRIVGCEVSSETTF